VLGTCFSILAALLVVLAFDPRPVWVTAPALAGVAVALGTAFGSVLALVGRTAPPTQAGKRPLARAASALATHRFDSTGTRTLICRGPEPTHDPVGVRAIARSEFSSRRLSYAALMVAAGLTGVYAEPIPNFEILTLVVFCSGVLLGSRDGALVAALSELIFSVLNPYGAVHPLVTLAQVVGMTIAGIVGGVAARLGMAQWRPAVRAPWLALIGVIVTLVFDLVTNLASVVVYGQLKLTLIGGLPFALIHIGTNAVLFAAVGTPLVSVFAHYRRRLSS
jgi:hypothetical protein